MSKSSDLRTFMCSLNRSHQYETFRRTRVHCTRSYENLTVRRVLVADYRNGYAPVITVSAPRA